MPRHHRRQRPDATIFQPMDHRPRSARHLESRRHPVQRLHAEAARTVTWLLPRRSTVRTPPFPCGGLHSCLATLADDLPEPSAPNAPLGVQQVKRPPGHFRRGDYRQVDDWNSHRRISVQPWPQRNPRIPRTGSRLRYNQIVTVTVLLFASLAEAAGARSVDLPAEPGDTVAHVRDRLLERYPHLERFVPNLLYALDEEYVKPWEPVADGATIALIPPVSGGC